MIQKEEDCGEREEMVVKTRRDQRKKEERDEEEQSCVAASICLPPSHAEEVVSAQLERVGRTMDGKGGMLAKKERVVITWFSKGIQIPQQHIMEMPKYSAFLARSVTNF